MELSSLISFATNASIPALIFIIWFLSYRQNNEQFLKQQEHTKALIEQIVQITRDNQQYIESLTGVLIRLETKIDNSAICPLTKERIK